MSIKICFFGDAQSEHTQRWVKEVSCRGFETYIVTNRPKDLPFTTVIELPEIHMGKLGWFLRILAIRKIVRDINPDIVHGHYITSYGFWAAASGVQPLVLTAWGSDILVSPKRSKIIRWITSWAIGKAKLITADAEDVLDEIKVYQTTAKLEQVQWGIDLNRYSYHSQLLKKKDDTTFVSLRSWEKLYHITTIIRAFAQLSAQNENKHFHLHVLGGGSQEGEIIALANKLGVSRGVTFHGRVDEAKMLSVLEKSDVSISVPESDGTAMSVLESMAIGLPMIVSNLPANRQWVDDQGGVIVQVGDAESLCKAMLFLANNQNLRKKMGKRNRGLVENHADRLKEMDKMAGMYRKLVDAG